MQIDIGIIHFGLEFNGLEADKKNGVYVLHALRYESLMENNLLCQDAHD